MGGSANADRENAICDNDCFKDKTKTIECDPIGCGTPYDWAKAVNPEMLKVIEQRSTVDGECKQKFHGITGFDVPSTSQDSMAMIVEGTKISKAIIETNCALKGGVPMMPGFPSLFDVLFGNGYGSGY